MEEVSPSLHNLGRGLSFPDRLLSKHTFPFIYLFFVGRVTQSVQRLLRIGRSGDRIPTGARFSAPVETGPGGHPASCTMGTVSFPGDKELPGRDADPSPPSSAVVMKEQSYTSTPPMGRTACTKPQCLYKGALYLYYHKQDSVWCSGASDSDRVKEDRKCSSELHSAV